MPLHSFFFGVECLPWHGCTCRVQEAQAESSWRGRSGWRACCAASEGSGLAWLQLQAAHSVRMLMGPLSSKRQGAGCCSQPSASGCSVFPEQRAQQ